MSAPNPFQAGPPRDQFTPQAPIELGRDRVEAAGTGKKSKQETNYRKGSPKERCALCVHFDERGGCELVAGKIDADGVCDLFEPESPSQERQEVRSGVESPTADQNPAGY